MKEAKMTFKRFLQDNLNDHQDQRDKSENQSQQIQPPFSLPKINLLEKSNSVERYPRVTFEIIEMPAKMKLELIPFVNNALDKHNANVRKTVLDLCEMLNEKYQEPISWACVMGTDFQYTFKPVNGKVIDFFIGYENRVEILAFVPNYDILSNEID